MSNEFTCKYSAAEINKAVQALALPASLQGVDDWKGSREIGGNVAAHLSAVNGKALALGVCQVFGDFFFGAESRANILKGIKSARVRRAFEVATAETIRLPRALGADDMLTFYRAFERSRMEQTPLAKAKGEALAEAVAPTEAVAPAATPVEAIVSENNPIYFNRDDVTFALKSERIKTAQRIKALRASNKALRMQLADAIAALGSKTKKVSKAKQAA